MALVLLFCLLALARPRFGQQEEMVKTTGLDVVVALDVSNSMLVEDVVPSRLKKAKHLLRGLVEGLGSDRVGLVAFAGSAYLASPITNDKGYFLDVLETLGPSAILTQGTDLGVALETSAKALERGSEDPQSEDATLNQATKVVVVVSDGEDFSDNFDEGLRMLKKIGSKLYVFGVGTEAGGPIPMRDEHEQLRGYKRDAKNQVVVSRFSNSKLKQVAEEAGGRYWDITVNEAELDEVLREMNSLQRGDLTERKRISYIERFQIPLAFALLFLILDLGLRRKSVQALLLFVSLWGLDAQASPQAYFENEDALRAYREGRLEEARKKFGQAQAYDPESPELRYNQGVMNLEDGNHESALNNFDQAQREASRQGKKDLEARSYYNLGEAFSKLGKTDEAIEAFINSIEKAREAGDSVTEKEARQKLMAQYQESQAPSQGSGDPNGEKKEEEGKDQQGNNQDKQGKQENQPQGYKQTPKYQKFKSEKLDPQDAERVMKELSSKEKQLQMKLRRQSGKQTRESQEETPGKDW